MAWNSRRIIKLITLWSILLLCLENVERAPSVACSRSIRAMARLDSWALFVKQSDRESTTIKMAALENLIARKATRWPSHANCAS